MKKIIPVFCITMILVLATGQSQAQYTRSDFKKHWYIGFNTGPNIFIGDIKQYNIWPVTENKNEVRFGGGGFIGYKFTPVFSLRGQALYGELAGTNSKKDRFFQGVIFEGNLSAVINISNWWGGYRPDRTLSFYGYGGLGFCNYKSRLENLSTGALISEKGYDDGFGLVGTKLAGIGPLGLGANLMLSHNLKLSLESSLHISNTDYLDNYTGVRLPVDAYSYSSIGLTYEFKGKPKPAKTGTQPDFAKKTEQKPVTQKPEAEKDVEYKPLIDREAIKKQPTTEITETKPIKIEVPEEKPVEKKTTESLTEEIETQPAFFYSVQVCAQKSGKLNQNFFRNKYKFQMPLNESVYNGYYIYTTGRFDTYNEAKQLRDMVRNSNNIPGAFVVAFKNGERMSKLP